MAVTDQDTTLEILADAARLLANARSMDDVLVRIVGAAREVTGATYGALGVVGRDGTHTRFVHEGFHPETVAAIGRLPDGHGVLGQVIRSEDTIVLDDLESADSFVGFPDAHPPMGAFVGTPIRFDGRVFGNLYVAEKQGGFNSTDVQRLEILSVLAGGAIQQARLQSRIRGEEIEEERARLARDLHDGVIQRIFSAGLTVEAARAKLRTEPEVTDRYLDNVIDLLDGAVVDLRATLVDLRSSEIEHLPLHEGVRRLAKEFERTALKFPDLVVEQGLDDRLHRGVSADVLHVVRESLSNIARHASATNVDLSIVSAGEALVMRVIDDGIGFDTRAVPRGRGLGNTQERAALHGGSMLIESGPGAGTRVEVRFEQVLY